MIFSIKNAIIKEKLESFSWVKRLNNSAQETQKIGNYLLKRQDKKNGFMLNVLKANKTILTVDYGENGGVVSNISATQEEIDAVVHELNTCLPKKSYVK